MINNTIHDLTQEQIDAADHFYAVRGDLRRVEAQWFRIVDYDYLRKQGHGNAAKIRNFQDALTFAQSAPRSEKYCFCFSCGMNLNIQEWVRKQGNIAKILFVTVTANICLYGAWKLLYFGREKFYCDSYFWEDTDKCGKIQYCLDIVKTYRSQILLLIGTNLALSLSALMMWFKSLFD